jgi:hypothetical protein
MKIHLVKYSEYTTLTKSLFMGEATQFEDQKINKIK